MSVEQIAKALGAFQAEMPTVRKSHTAYAPDNRGGSRAYTYADLADVTEAAMPLLVKHGLSFTACPQRIEANGEYELAGILLHESGERIEGCLPLRGRSAQEVGSAITYARRYLLGCLTGIVTDDDDDGAATSGVTTPAAARTDDAAVAVSVDAETALYDAIDATDDPAELSAIYRTHNVGQAPAAVRDRFAARVNELRDALTEGAA